MRLYILDDAGDPIPCADLLTWARWYETADRRVARTEIGEAAVSTVFLAVDHNFLGRGPSVLYETLVFLPHGDTGQMLRYSTRAQAEAGHAQCVHEIEQQVRVAHALTLDSIARATAAARAALVAPAPAPKRLPHHQPVRTGAARRRRRYLNLARRELLETA